MHTRDLMELVERILKRLDADPFFQATIPEGEPREVFKRFVGAFFPRLQGQLDEKLTFASFARAKTTALNIYANVAFLERLYGAYPGSNGSSLFEPHEIPVMSRVTHEGIVRSLEKLSATQSTIYEWMRRNEATEEEALIHFKWINLCEEAMTSFRADTLTVGELLELQPWTLLGATRTRDSMNSIERIWDTLQDDESFRAAIPVGEAHNIFEEFVCTVPKLLEGQLDERLSFASFARAKSTVLTACADRAFLERLYGAYPKSSLVFTPDDMALLSKANLESFVRLLEQLSTKLYGWLQANKATEEEALVHFRWIHLSDYARDRFRAGTLTVGELLELQPWDLLGASSRSNPSPKAPATEVLFQRRCLFLLKNLLGSAIALQRRLFL